MRDISWIDEAAAAEAAPDAREQLASVSPISLFVLINGCLFTCETCSVANNCGSTARAAVAPIYGPLSFRASLECDKFEYMGT